MRTSPLFPTLLPAVHLAVAVDEFDVFAGPRHAQLYPLRGTGVKFTIANKKFCRRCARRMNDTTLLSLSLQSIHWKPGRFEVDLVQRRLRA